MNRNIRTTANRGFTLVELVVVVTIIGLLAAMAVVAYNSAVNNAKSAKSAALVNTLSTAKSLFVADPNTTSANIEAYNAAANGGAGGSLDTAFAFIAPYIRVNGATMTTSEQLLSLSGFPATGVTIVLGTVDDTALTPPGTNTDQPPQVTGYP
jgi:prepilin-type N-terminal cleavage/methylation domain-containing protein